VPLDGTFKNPKVHIGYALLEVLSNAFIHSIHTSINCRIDFNSAKTKD